MSKLFSLLFSLFTGVALLHGQSAVQRLHDVKAIYVNPLRGENAVTATIVTEKLITYLAKRHSVSIVDSGENSDAILYVSLTIQTVSDEFGRPAYRVNGAAHLDSKDGVVLWADDASNSRYGRSATSSFADNIAKKLAQAIAATSEKK